MSEIISCPACQTKLQLPEAALGKPVRCPKCGAVMPARPVAAGPKPGQPTTAPEIALPEGAAPADDLDATLVDDDPASPALPPSLAAPVAPPAPRRRDRAAAAAAAAEERADAWRTVRSGLTLHLVAQALYVVGVVGLFLATVASLLLGSGPEPSSPVLANGLAALSGCLVLANWVVAAVGHTFGLLAPPRHNARGLAAATVLMAALGLFELPYLFGPAGPPVVADALTPRPGTGMALVLLAVPEGARLTLFPLFLAAVARSCGAVRTVLPCRLLAALTPVLLALVLLVTLGAAGLALSAPSERTASWVVFFVALVGCGGLFVVLACGLALLVLVRRALSASLKAAPAGDPGTFARPSL